MDKQGRLRLIVVKLFEIISKIYIFKKVKKRENKKLMDVNGKISYIADV